MGRLGRRRAAAAAAFIAGAVGLAACSSGATAQTTSSSTLPTTPTSTPSGAKGLVWIVTRAALEDVSSDPSALAVLEAGKIYEILNADERPVAGVDAVVTEDFKSYAGMSAVVEDGKLVPGTQAILYDAEDWTATPVSEQKDLAVYIADAVTLAHEHGLQIIVTPALDLVNTIDPGTPATDQVAKFLDSGIEQAAAGADIVDVQAQSKETDPATYASFVLQAEAIIHARRAGAIVVAGLSTNPPHRTVTASELAAAIATVRGHVQGFWLNVPKGGPSCPSCSSNPDPQAGTGALVAAFG